MRRRTFLTKGAAGVFTLGAIGCSDDSGLNPVTGNGKGIPMTGLVADPAGNGVSGVTVTIAGGGLVKSVLTNVAGHYSADVPGRGEYTISPKMSGYTFNPVAQKITVTNERSFVVNSILPISNI